MPCPYSYVIIFIFTGDRLNVKCNSERHNRRKLCLQGYDYTQMHGIIFIVGAPLVGALSVDPRMVGKDRAGTRPAPTKLLGDIIGIFKSISTHQYAINVNANNWTAFPGTLWQRNFYERIIRNEDELNRIRAYILNNPQQWDNEDNNPHNITIKTYGI